MSEVKKEIVVADESQNIKKMAYNKDVDLSNMFHLPKQFSSLNRLVLRDLNGTGQSPTFYLYTKDQITEFLKNPYTNEKNIRNAVVYIYGASSHFRRLIQYFSSLSDLAYVVSPYKIDTATAKPQSVKRNYSKVLKINKLRQENIKNLSSAYSLSIFKILFIL